MPTYTKATPEHREILDEMLERYHDDLVKLRVRVDMLLAYPKRDKDGNSRGDALKLHGRPALAIASITKLKERAKGLGDCEILIDGDKTEKWPRDRLAALIDHELTHFEHNNFETDDLGRPKLTMRQHDIDLGWFDCVARRHGDHSIEVIQAKALFTHHTWRQVYLPGFEPEGDIFDPKPSITRRRAAKELAQAFGGEIEPASLFYAAVPHSEASEDGDTAIATRIVEAWVDPLERAVVFSAGKILELTQRFQLSARWASNGSPS